MRYKVGDILIGNESANTYYTFTRQGVKVKVVSECSNEYIYVTIIDIRYIGLKGKLYQVLKGCFDLINRGFGDDFIDLTNI